MTFGLLFPLQSKLIEKDDIIIDAKSGVSGAGRSAKVNLLYTEIAEGINSYGITKHRHMPEIEQVRMLQQHHLKSSHLSQAFVSCCIWAPYLLPTALLLPALASCWSLIIAMQQLGPLPALTEAAPAVQCRTAADQQPACRGCQRLQGQT